MATSIPRLATAFPLSQPVGRSVPEWVGKSPDEPFPPRVRLRILKAHGNRCASCTRDIRPGDTWTCDHIIAVINGGPNRESNGQPLCEWCNPKKNAADMAVKSKTASSQKKQYGLAKPKGRPLGGSKASGWRKRMNGQVERRSEARR